MYEDMRDNNTTGNYYDTGSTYTHYNSSEMFNARPPKKKKKSSASGFSVQGTRLFRRATIMTCCGLSPTEAVTVSEYTTAI